MCKSEEIATVVERTIKEVLKNVKEYKKANNLGHHHPKLKYFANIQVETTASKNKVSAAYIRKVLDLKNQIALHR